MRTFDYVITAESGFRPLSAGELVSAAEEFESHIKIITGHKSADAKRILSVVSLGARKGQRITVETEGIDEIVAARRLRLWLTENM